MEFRILKESQYLIYLLKNSIQMCNKGFRYFFQGEVENQLPS